MRLSASRDPQDHLSRALRLVELTYPANAAVHGDGDRAELSENWAHQPNAGVRELLLQLVGRDAALSSDDLAIVLQQRSGARGAVRLRVFEVDEAALASYFDEIEVLNGPADEVADQRAGRARAGRWAVPDGRWTGRPPSGTAGSSGGWVSLCYSISFVTAAP